MNKPTWKKRITIGIMSVALLGGVVYTGNEIQNTQPEIAETVGAAKATTFAKTTYQPTVNLNMRSGASTKHKVLVTIPKGSKVTSTSRIGDWYKVTYKGKTGYVSVKYLKKVASTSVSTTTSYKTKSSVALKAGKHRNHKTLMTIPKGKTVTFVKAHGSWTQVKYAGKTGYVPTASLSKGSAVPPAPATPVSSLYSTKKTTEVKPGKHRKYKTLVTVPKGKTVTLVQRYGSWAKIKYGKTTGYVPFANLQKGKAPVVSTPKPTPAKSMTREAAEKHLDVFMDKDGKDYKVMFENNSDATMGVYFTDVSTSKAYLWLNMVNYNAMNDIRPDDFGREAYNVSKKRLAITNSAIKRYAETQFGVNSSASKQFISEVKKTSTYTSNVQKTITISGKNVEINGGIGTVQFIVL